LNNHLHIVCLDVPYPPDYGGVVDLYCKIKSLHRAGVEISLHCFEYGRGKQPELEKYCKEVFYYPRNKKINFRLPYIVSSRNNRQLISNLQRDDDPVLLEGIHCTYPLFTGKLNSERVWIRLHNIEYRYYSFLAKHAHNLLRKTYYTVESYLLKKYESDLAPHNRYLAVSLGDIELYRKLHPRKIEFLPVFLPNNEVRSQEGKGDFILYHGNLSVEENERAAIWLLESGAHQTGMPLIIAGKNPSKKLLQICKKNSVTCLQNISPEKMEELMCSAHIHLVPSFNATGIKLKLLNALFLGRFVITNTAAVAGSGVESLCSVADSPEELIRQIRYFSQMDFNQNDIERRKEIMESLFNAEKNTRHLVRLLFH